MFLLGGSLCVCVCLWVCVSVWKRGVNLYQMRVLRIYNGTLVVHGRNWPTQFYLDGSQCVWNMRDLPMKSGRVVEKLVIQRWILMYFQRTPPSRCTTSWGNGQNMSKHVKTCQNMSRCEQHGCAVGQKSVDNLWTIDIGVISCYIMLYHVISCYIMLYHVISCYIMLYHVISQLAEVITMPVSIDPPPSPEQQ